MPQGSFAAQVNSWVAATKARQLAVFRESVQRTIAVAQEPGPSKASTRRAVASGAGLGKVRKDGSRGLSKKAFGPVHAGGSGHLPVDTGFLRASLMVLLGKTLPPFKPNPEGVGHYDYDSGQVGVVLAGATISDAVTAAYTARYARVVEYRYRFVGLASQQWPQIVSRVAAELQGRVQGAEAARVYQAGG